MRPEPNGRIERFRNVRMIESRLCANTNVGAFVVPFKGVHLQVIASDGGGWDHVSVSLPDRCPTWDEMCHIKSLWWGDDECVIQFHPPASEYVNNHSYCLHLWKPQDEPLPMPPSIFVGIKGLAAAGIVA